MFFSALFTTARRWKQPLDEEGVAHVHNGIPRNQETEWTQAIGSKRAWTRAPHSNTAGKQTSYSNTYMGSRKMVQVNLFGQEQRSKQRRREHGERGGQDE